MSANGTILANGNLAVRLHSHNAPSSSPLRSGRAALRLRGGVVVEVTTPSQARIAEAARAAAVLVISPVAGGVSRMSDPDLIRDIKASVRIPVMASVRIGHFVEAQILQAIGVDFIDESTVLTPADDAFHIDKNKFRLPFVCASCNLGDALQRIAEGAAVIRVKGEPGTGNIVETAGHARSMQAAIRTLRTIHSDEIYCFAHQIRAPLQLVKLTKQFGRLPVVNLAGSGVATPADAALMMYLGCDGVFVESDVFNSRDPSTLVEAIVKAVTHYNDPVILAEISSNQAEAAAE